VSYLEFLARWHNLPFLALALGALVAGLWGRTTRRRTTALSTGLAAAALIGLTWNGALHDLGVEDYGRRFPLVLLVSLVAGGLLGVGLDRLRRRVFPPVEGVAFTEPGLEGSDARIVSRTAGPEPASGRAQWQDEAGVIHVIRVHTSGDVLRFGRRVRLAEWYEAARSYLVETV
jgi:hypothetical protein